MPFPTAIPHAQTAEYLAACKNPAVASLADIEQAARVCSRAVNAGIQQVGLWQGELRDAEFAESNGELRVRLNNCDQRQQALLRTLTEMATLLQRVRVNLSDLRGDQIELARCADVSGAL